jgi:hypothetical protein
MWHINEKMGHQTPMSGGHTYMKAATCVRTFVPIGLLSVALCASVSAQDGLQLFHEMQKALGGADHIAALRDFEERVHAQTWNNKGKLNAEEQKRTRWIRPNYLRLDQVGHDNNTYVLYFDGTSGWEILPDKRVLDLVGDELKFAQGYLLHLDFKIWLADRDPRYVITSPSKNILRISDKNDVTNAQDITLDPNSFLPIKQTAASHGHPSRAKPTETRFEEWKMVQGIQFPHRISMIKNGKPLALITVDQIKLDDGLKVEDLATKPSDLNPVITPLK